MPSGDHREAPSASFYNHIASFYDDYCTHSGIKLSLGNEIALVESYNPQSILEFGIGTGRFAKEYLKRNSHVVYVGVDSAEDMLCYAHDSGATLIHSDIIDYIAIAKKQALSFDCIIAPYTALHHIALTEQRKLIIDMQSIAQTVILNCLNEETERRAFGESNETLVTFLLPQGKAVTTKIYRIDNEVRKKSVPIADGNDRVFLIQTRPTDTEYSLGSDEALEPPVES